MKKFVDLRHNAETHETVIQYQGKNMDVSSINGIPVSEWGHPFVKNGVRWYGLYTELKNFCGEERFSITFHGSEQDMQIIKKILSDENIEIFSEYNKVNLVYNHTDFSTKITVNGKSLDMSALKGIPLQQLVNPVEERYWRGLFVELQEYMCNMPFTIIFAGDSEDMNCLISDCPENVNLSYKAANFSETATALFDSAKTVMQNVNVPETVNVGGRTFTRSILARIAILFSLICFIFPFVSVSCNTEESEQKNYSGIQLMTAFGQENDEMLSNMDEIFSPNIFLIIAFILGILTLLVLMAHHFWGKLSDSIASKLAFISNNPNLWGGIMSAVSAMFLLIFRFSFVAYYDLSQYKDYLVVKNKFGFILSLLFMIGGAVLCFLSQEENPFRSVNKQD